MNQTLLTRIVWPLFMGAVTYVACRFLTPDNGVCLGVALLPVVLGALGVLRQVGYAVTGLTIIAAVFVSVTTPEQREELAARGGNVVQRAQDRLNASEARAAPANVQNSEAAPSEPHPRHHHHAA